MLGSTEDAKDASQEVFARIQELQPWLNGEYAVLLRTGTRLTLSRGYREKLQDRLRA